MKNKFFVGLLGVMLVFALAFAACVNEINPDKTGEPDAVINAAMPQITAHPQSAVYTLNAEIKPLTVTASEPSDKGTLNYQWYSNETASNSGGTEIPAATKASFTPTLSSSAEGEAYYYVVVTNHNKNATNNKNNSVTSNAAHIRVYDSATSSEPPIITAQPRGGEYIVESQVSLTVSAAVSEGALSYQWYNNTVNSNNGGSVIAGAVNEVYTFTANTTGDYYYYVVITNTNAGKTAQTVSNAIKVSIIIDNFDPNEANITVRLNNTQKEQFIRGVGGMSDQCFIYTTGSWTDRVTLDDIQNMFGHGPQELGLNMLRMLMYPYLEEGIIGYTRSPNGITMIHGDPRHGIVDDIQNYTFGPTGSKSGTLPQDQSDYYNIIKKVNEMGGYVIITPWALPREFTVNSSSGSQMGNGTGSGSYVDQSKFNELADWYVSYVENLIDKGAPIFAISLQNEPDMGVSYDGCRWRSNDMRDFLRVLGPKIAHLKGYGGGEEQDKIWLGVGDNAGLPGEISDNAINDTGPTGASQYADLALRHLYGGMGAYTNGPAHIADPNKGLKEVWQTEHCDTTSASARDPEAVRNAMSSWDWVWHIANETYQTFYNNKENAFIWWTAKRFYGYIGEGNYTTTQGAVLPRGHVMAHFGKYVRNTNMISVDVSGNFVSNNGIAAGSGSGSLGNTGTAVAVGNASNTNVNPTSFTQGNSDTGGQNQPTTKIMAFEAEDGSYITVVAFTPTRNSGAGGQDAGNVLIRLPAGFTASSAELMRSTESAKQQIEEVVLNKAGTAAMVTLPRSNIISVKFFKEP